MVDLEQDRAKFKVTLVPAPAIDSEIKDKYTWTIIF